MRKLALLVIDMQQGLFSSPPHDADGLVSRINSLAARMRAKRVPVIFIQHCGPEGDDLHPRSEEHTSELQSLMRISYAVFCLKKKNNKRHTKKTKSNTNTKETAKQ